MADTPSTPNGTRADRAITVRDLVLPEIRQNGTLVRMQDVSIVMWTLAPWRFSLRTPFSNWGSGQAPAQSHQDAAILQRTPRALPYGLDIWREKKVLSVEWGDDQFNLISFRPGIWDLDLIQDMTAPTKI